jgi:L-rhamnose mutarotase
MYNLEYVRNIKFALIILLFHLFISCKNEKTDKFSSTEKKEILDTIKSRIKINLDDYSIFKKEPTDILFINSAFLLNKKTVDIYEKQGWVRNSDEDLEDFIEVKVIKYNFKREDGKSLKIKDINQIEVGNSPYFEENKKMYSNFNISIPLDNPYTKLNGNIMLELKIDNQNKREFSIPVKINIGDFFNK